ncbi:MAG: hypothetical protein LBH59_08740 [Planctomycetaceae bacterium]|nr:hypothetical protein [Planctomycetaceae bacterium]
MHINNNVLYLNNFKLLRKIKTSNLIANKYAEAYRPYRLRYKLAKFIARTICEFFQLPYFRLIFLTKQPSQQ